MWAPLPSTKTTTTTITTMASNPPAATPKWPNGHHHEQCFKACKTWVTPCPFITCPAPYHPLHHWNQTGQMRIGIEREAETEIGEGENRRKKRRKRPTRGRKKIIPRKTISCEALCMMLVSKKMLYPFWLFNTNPRDGGRRKGIISHDRWLPPSPIYGPRYEELIQLWLTI